MGTADETFQTQLARAKNADGFLAALDQVRRMKILLLVEFVFLFLVCSSSRREIEFLLTVATEYSYSLFIDTH